MGVFSCSAIFCSAILVCPSLKAVDVLATNFDNGGVVIVSTTLINSNEQWLFLECHFHGCHFMQCLFCSAILVCPSFKAVDVFGNKL